MERYINYITIVSDITYLSELTRHEAWRVQFAQTTYDLSVIEGRKLWAH